MSKETELVEFRWHGRGGQGTVTSAELLAKAAISEGKFAQGFPSLGPERRGAPVQAFDRISNSAIRIRAEVKEPDVVVVLDPSLLRVVNVTAGLKPNGLFIINTKRTLQDIEAELGNKWRIATIDAGRIARETLGVPIVNTTMLGAVIKATGVIELESLLEPLQERFGRMADRNAAAMRKAFEETAMKELKKVG